MLFAKKKEVQATSGLTGASPSGQVEWLIVGLGNPEKKYENTRHNAGFRAVDTIAADCGAEIKKLKFKALVGDAEIAGKHCLLMKPETYMNLSGQAVMEAVNFYKLPTDHVIVLFDDISLSPGKLRIRRKGSDGGHNGIKNIIYLSGKDDFPRVKLGVGAKPHPDYDLAAWVLSSFTPDEQKALQESLGHCPEIAKLIIEGNIDQAMNRFNA